MQFVVRGIFRLLFRVRVRGLRHLPPGPKIICTNHLGWADAFLVLLFFPVQPRIYALADHHAVGRTGFRATMMRALRVVVTLDPDKPLEALRIMEGVLRRGGSLHIAPEGAPTQNPVEGQVRPLSSGAAYLSALTGAPLVPVGIRGTSELWLGRRILVAVGKPIYPDHVPSGARERRAATAALTHKLELSLRALIPRHPRRDGPPVRLLRKWLTNVFA
jgi:1-acyl-sn-glycerol-3-phosphate acyltransferase